MTHTHTQVQFGLRIGRWMLPWIAAVVVSASVAFAVNGAMAGGSSAGDRRQDVQAAVSTGESAGPAAVERSSTSPSAQSADLGRSVTPERCAPIGSSGYGIYVDSSIVAESRKIDCGWAP